MHRRVRSTVMVVVLVLGTGAACAKKPATIGASAPPPTGATTGPSAGSHPSSTVVPGGPGAGTSASSAPVSSARPKPTEFIRMADIADIHFDFDKYELRPDAVKIVEGNARLLNGRRNTLILIEGHCDERGTSEYNLALGERRARAAMSGLTARGVDARRVTIVSYGEDRPTCRDHTEACWARNRRATFLVKD